MSTKNSSLSVKSKHYKLPGHSEAFFLDEIMKKSVIDMTILFILRMMLTGQTRYAMLSASEYADIPVPLG